MLRSQISGDPSAGRLLLISNWESVMCYRQGARRQQCENRVDMREGQWGLWVLSNVFRCRDLNVIAGFSLLLWKKWSNKVVFLRPAHLYVFHSTNLALYSSHWLIDHDTAPKKRNGTRHRADLIWAKWYCFCNSTSSFVERMSIRSFCAVLPSGWNVLLFML